MSLTQHRAMEGRRRLVQMAALLGAFCLTPQPGDACVNILPATVSPRGLAPMNTHVWIHGAQLPFTGGATFVLIASSAPRKPIAAKLRAWDTSSLWELVPDAPLAPNAQHEVWAIEQRGANAAPAVILPIGRFTTTADLDTTAPGAPTLREAHLNVPLGSCSPWIGVAGQPLADDEAAPFYAVHHADEAGNLLYDRAPREIVRWPRATATNPRPLLELTTRGPTAALLGKRLGLRAIDLAGNLGPPVEITIEP